MIKSIQLPWPPKDLSPNARVHWGQKRKATKMYRELCCLSARTQNTPKIQAGKIDVRLIFTPPDHRHRDDDNMIGAFKAGRDGIADWIGVDDRNWNTNYAFRKPEKPGGVTVEIYEEGSADAA